MRTAFWLLIGLVAVTPAIAFMPTLLVAGLVGAVLAIATGLAAWGLRPGEAAHVAKVIRPVAIMGAVPALWMLVQILPVPLAWSHPIWTSAQAALDDQISGRLSIDPGATLIALFQHLTALAAFGVAAAAGIDRRRAEWLLLCLVFATSVLAALRLAHVLGIYPTIGEFGGDIPATMQTASAVGPIVAAAALIWATERYETRGASAAGAAGLLLPFALPLLGFILCCYAVVATTTAPVLFASACGLATVLVVVAIRRLGLGAIASASVATLALVIAVTIAAGWTGKSGNAFMLRYAANTAPESAASTERMMADTGWAGVGAGNYSALLPIYRDSNDPVVDRAPTTASAISIELGRPALWVILAFAVALLGLLLGGALRRGRDSFYSIAAAGCLVTLAIEAFIDASLLATTSTLLAGPILGLGFAQSRSRIT